jgi:hypothetical protein
MMEIAESIASQWSCRLLISSISMYIYVYKIWVMMKHIRGQGTRMTSSFEVVKNAMIVQSQCFVSVAHTRSYKYYNYRLCLATNLHDLNKSAIFYVAAICVHIPPILWPSIPSLDLGGHTIQIFGVRYSHSIFACTLTLEVALLWRHG